MSAAQLPRERTEPALRRAVESATLRASIAEAAVSLGRGASSYLPRRCARRRFWPSPPWLSEGVGRAAIHQRSWRARATDRRAPQRGRPTAEWRPAQPHGAVARASSGIGRPRWPHRAARGGARARPAVLASPRQTPPQTPPLTPPPRLPPSVVASRRTAERGGARHRAAVGPRVGASERGAEPAAAVHAAPLLDALKHAATQAAAEQVELRRRERALGGAVALWRHAAAAAAVAAAAEAEPAAASCGGRRPGGERAPRRRGCAPGWPTPRVPFRERRSCGDGRR